MKSLTKSLSALLLAYRLQFGDDLEILRSPGGHLALDQRVEADDTTPLPEYLDHRRALAQHFEIESTGDLAD